MHRSFASTSTPNASGMEAFRGVKLHRYGDELGAKPRGIQLALGLAACAFASLTALWLLRFWPSRSFLVQRMPVAQPAPVAGPSPQPEPPPIPAERLEEDVDGRGLPRLSDVQLRSFVARGFLVLDPGPEFDAKFHADVAADARRKVNDQAVAASNNLAALIPNATRLITESRSVRAAVTAILGEGAVLHAHRHLHEARDGSDQCWHKDSYFGTRRMRDHRPRWAMAMYYPSRVTLDMGPTFVQPYSHYSTIDTADVATYGEDRLGMSRPESQRSFSYTCPDHAQRLRNLDEDTRELWPGGTMTESQRRGVPLTVPAGSVVLIHYDLLHRGSSRLSSDAAWRPMFKWQFVRVREPLAGGERRNVGKGRDERWREFLPPHSVDGAWPPAPPDDVKNLMQVWEDVYGYLTNTNTGDSSTGDGSGSGTVALGGVLHNGSSEAERLGAAYELGQRARLGDGIALQVLLRAMSPPSSDKGGASTFPEHAMRAVMRGLSTAGHVAIAPLSRAVEHELGISTTGTFRHPRANKMRFLVAALAEAIASQSLRRLHGPGEVEEAIRQLCLVARSSQAEVGDSADDLLDVARSTAAEGLGRAVAVHYASLPAEDTARAIRTLTDVMDDCASDSRSVLFGFDAGDERPLPQAAAFGLLLIARAAADADKVDDDGDSRDAPAPSHLALLVPRLRRAVAAGGPGRYVLSYALEALRALAERDPDVSVWLLDHLFASRWCVHTTSVSQY